MRQMSRPHDLLLLEDADLLAQCEVDTYRASGPGGQHRNKVSSAVRLRHDPTGIEASGEESRSQHENKRRALRRLRMKIATSLRSPAPPGARVPPVVRECVTGRGQRKRLEVGRRDRRYWPVVAFLLDLLDGAEGRVGEAARTVGATTGSVVSVLKADRHALAAAQEIRRRHEKKPLN